MMTPACSCLDAALVGPGPRPFGSSDISPDSAPISTRCRGSSHIPDPALQPSPYSQVYPHPSPQDLPVSEI